MSTADEIVLVSVKATGTPKRRAVCYETEEEWLRDTRRKLAEEKAARRMERWMEGMSEHDIALARRTMETCIRYKTREMFAKAIDKMFTTFLLRYDSSEPSADPDAKFAALFHATERFNDILGTIHATTDEIDQY